MGDIADMMLNGDLDMETGEYLGPGDGFPRAARHIGNNWSDVFPKGMHPQTPKNTKCPECSRMLRGDLGLRDHLKAVHGIKG